MAFFGEKKSRVIFCIMSLLCMNDFSLAQSSENKNKSSDQNTNFGVKPYDNDPRLIEGKSRVSSESKKKANDNLSLIGDRSQANDMDLAGALSTAYTTNPQLKAQRANTRGIDENLQIALGSFMPTVQGQASAGILSFNLLNSQYNASAFGGTDGLDLKSNTNPVLAGVTATMNIFNGFKGVNGVNQASAQIHQSRELLRASEMTVFQAVVESYMNVLSDTAIYDVRRKYVDVLSNQIKITEEKVHSGEISQTDLDQVGTYLAQSEKQTVSANTSLMGSIAFLRRVIGTSPKRVSPASIPKNLLPKSLDEAISLSMRDHPMVIAARYNVEINQYAIKMAESQLLPKVDAVAGYGQNWNYFGTQGQRLYQGGGAVQVSVPFYDGGVSYGQIRQAKEKLGEAQSLYDLQVSLVRQQVETQWASWKNSEKLLSKAKEQVHKAEAALAGLRYEIRYGLRTTWDVLNYQQILTDARIGYIGAQKERVIASYNLLASIGALNMEHLEIDVLRYDPKDHYDQVHFQMIGTEPWK